MRVVLLGPPGSGKGTQSDRLKRRLGVAHISSGDLLRDAVRSDSELGCEAKQYMDRGSLVPDVLVLALIAERVGCPDCDAGFLLDGFPRNIEQAHELDALLERSDREVDAVVELELSAEDVLRRLCSRLTCSSCGRVYNVLCGATGAEGVCDDCGGELTVRADDNEATIRERLSVYESQTRPLLDYYGAKGLLRSVDAAGDIDMVSERLMAAVEDAA